MKLIKFIKEVIRKITGVSLFSFGISWQNSTENKIDDIVYKYINILNGKNKGHAGLRGLIEAGAAFLENSKDLHQICEKIVMHSKPNPIPEWIKNKFNDYDDLLRFIKWQSKRNIENSHYFGETNFQKIVNIYRNESKTNQI